MSKFLSWAITPKIDTTIPPLSPYEFWDLRLRLHTLLQQTPGDDGHYESEKEQLMGELAEFLTHAWDGWENIKDGTE